MRATVSQIENMLENERIHLKRSETDPNFFIARHSGNPELLDVVQKGLVTIQDHSQGLVARMTAPQAGEEVLDLCSAPGGKTGYLAELCPDCMISATDRDDARLESVRQLVERARYSNITVAPYDEILAERRKYDAVLVDAPCTGTGVLARRPDLRWRRDPSDVKRMAAVQFQILRYAADRVKTGGRLIYSTCSIEPEENRGVVNSFLEAYPYFKLGKSADEVILNHVDSDGILSKTGPEISGDGVFAVRLERVN